MNTQIETKEAVRGHWNDTTVAERYENERYGNIQRSLSHYLDCDAIDTFLKNYFGNKDTLLLDMACGTARLTRAVNTAGRKIISVDYSDHMLLEAKKKLGAYFLLFNPVRCDGFSLPFKPETFDAVFTTRFIRHYKKPERIKIYAQLNRVLKKNGILIFDVLNKDMDRDAYKRPMHDQTYSLEGISGELRENGFVLKDRLAGNITEDPFFVICKKWSLISLGRWYGKIIRSKKIHLDKAVFWMVCASKIA